jgi:lipopolysaccharide export system protein LptC
LRLKPDEFVAETPARVRVEMGGRQLRATGLIAYLKEDRLELQSNVNGQFRP